MPKKSYKKYVEDMCKACIYDPGAEGAWRQQVEACTATSCPLYEVRPVSSATVVERQRVARRRKMLGDKA
jgi:hypothetical protein